MTMNYLRTPILFCSFAAGVLLAGAQTPPAPPAPPAPTAPAIAPMAPMAPMEPMAPMTPMAPMAPMPPMPMVDLDLNLDLDLNFAGIDRLDLQDQVRAARENADMVRGNMDQIRENAELARENANRMRDDLRRNIRANINVDVDQNIQNALNLAFDQQTAPKALGFPTQPIGPGPAWKMPNRNMSEDRLYINGQSALDSRHWDQALEYFTQAVALNGPRTDGALYWKAYTLGKLGRRDEGIAAITELRKSFATSRWLDDAKALELELKQASGQNVSPDSESDDELKLMAINGLMQNDPERAMPLLEKQLKETASPRVKRNALFVLAQSNSPKAQALIEQIARGGANPDLQLKAISYMTERRRTNNAQVLGEIYAATTDISVKKAILLAWVSGKEKDRLLQAANPELWQLYGAETDPEAKRHLLRFMYNNTNADKLLDVVRNEKDPNVRADALRVLGSQPNSAVSGDALVAIYSTATDEKMKQSIVDTLGAHQNGKALVAVARSEKDPKLKLRIVERLSHMKSKEASDYLAEILGK
jgi:tetratricopeptide (TPR) repeat protein